MHDMSDFKFMSEMIEQDTSQDSDSDCDIPSDFGTCPCEAELERLPEVVIFIKRLQSFVYRQQSKLYRLHKELKEHKSKKRKKCNIATQTEDGYEAQSEAAPAWSRERTNKEVEETWSLAEQVKEAAQTAMQLTGFVYEETSGMYYDYSTGYYYNAELGLYYDGNSGTYYYYDNRSKAFQFHSQVEAVHQTVPTSTAGVKCEEHESKRRNKHKGSKESKKVKHDKSCEHDSNNSGAESLEEGECSDSSEEDGICSSGASSIHEMDTDQEVSKGWPPCIRIIVKETNLEQLKVGTLFIVTCTGGTMGREGDHAVSVPDINISKVFHAIPPDDRIYIAHRKFARTILDEKLDKDNEFPRKIIHSDEAAFRISGKGHKQNVHIWESEHSRAAVEHITDSPRVNIRCGLLQGHLIGSFFCAKATGTSTSYLDVLRNLGSFPSGDT